MGTWGTKVLDNDAALDIKGDFEEQQDISVLKEILAKFLALPDKERDVDLCQEVVAAIYLWTESDFSGDQEFIQLVLQCLSYILESSELKNMWAESDELSEWSAEMSVLSSKIADKIKLLS